MTRDTLGFRVLSVCSRGEGGQTSQTRPATNAAASVMDGGNS